MPHDTWQLQEAKAKFSALINASQKHPQVVTRHGEIVAYVVSADIYEGLAQHKPSKKHRSVADYFLNSPFAGSNLKIPKRRKDKYPSHREVVF